MNIFYLVDDILIMIFSEYIFLNEICNFDIALCNKKYRSYFLNLLSKLLPFKIDYFILNNDLFIWLYMKKIYIKNLDLKYVDFYPKTEDYYYKIEEFYLRNICDLSFNEIVYYINKFKNLKSIIINRDVVNKNIFEKINPIILKNLTSIDIIIFSKISLSAIEKYCTNIITLKINKGNINSLYNIIKNNINIKYLYLFVINKDILNLIKNNNKIEIIYGDWLNCSLNDFIEVINNTNIKSLESRNFKYTKNDELYIFYSNGNLNFQNRFFESSYKHIFFDRYFLLNDEILLKLINNSYNYLKSLKINKCDLISYKILKKIYEKLTNIEIFEIEINTIHIENIVELFLIQKPTLNKIKIIHNDLSTKHIIKILTNNNYIKELGIPYYFLSQNNLFFNFNVKIQYHI